MIVHIPGIVVNQNGRNAKMQTNTISKSQQNKQQTRGI